MAPPDVWIPVKLLSGVIESLLGSLWGCVRRPRSFEQNFRVDKWNVYRGYAATRSGSFVK